MRRNPVGDWCIEDVQRVCRSAGVDCTPPTRGSHWKISSPLLTGALTIPANRPVKAPYIRSLVSLIAAHCECEAEKSAPEHKDGR